MQTLPCISDGLTGRAEGRCGCLSGGISFRPFRRDEMRTGGGVGVGDDGDAYIGAIGGARVHYGRGGWALGRRDHVKIAAVDSA